MLLATLILGVAMATSFATADAFAADKKTEKKKPAKPAKKPPQLFYTDMQYGPALAYTLAPRWPYGNIVTKGLSIKLMDGNAGLLFDMDSLRVAAGWHGGFLDLSRTNLTRNKGDGIGSPATDPLFATKPGPAWAVLKDGQDIDKDTFKDKRTFERDVFPRSYGQFKGYYLLGERVVLSYRVGGVDILETVDAVEGPKGVDSPVFARMMIMKAAKPQRLAFKVCERKGWAGQVESFGDGRIATFLPKPKTQPNRGSSLVHMVSSSAQEFLKPIEEGIAAVVDVPANKPVLLRIAIAPRQWGATTPAAMSKSHSAMEKCFRTMDMQTPFEAMKTVESGGPARWPKTVETKAKFNQSIGFENNAYVMDDLTMPFDNPYRAWMRTGAFDFFADGNRAAISTWNGDVWIVTGVLNKDGNLKWKRFATGMHEPLGLKIEDDQLYVLGRDALWRLHDYNGDGEADFYEAFNNDGATQARCMSLTLQTDAAGNFYYLKNGNRAKSDVPMHGVMLRVSKDGQKLETFATGFRSANGSSISPTGVITSADNEGNWTPSTRLDIVEQGGFYGYRPHARRDVPMDVYEPPVCWIPKKEDSSAGSQAWVPTGDGNRWGPFGGQMVHTSFGTCKLFLVTHEYVPVSTDARPKGYTRDKVVQGGVIPFPKPFPTGIMRARFNPKDGQLYILGLKGWQTSGVRDGGLYRVKYTGKPVAMPRHVHATKKGLRIDFTCKLDKELAEDLESYAVSQWNYQYTSKYGSKEYSVKDPKKVGHDPVKVTKATLSKDGRSVFLTMPGIHPVMQMEVKLDLESEDGLIIDRPIYYTIHALADE